MYEKFITIETVMKIYSQSQPLYRYYLENSFLLPQASRKKKYENLFPYRKKYEIY